ncbi:MAG: hypothetical protein QMD44_08345 [Thermodesulfovibrionales bacterium]|jgi:hypothetical protein|nr:hypothetical protein [Thermodesulfovibrionales bacterium]RJR10503.1 MAG: hypothetical protein C4588_03140 [Candidatus Parcubacteria bacterium]
MSWKCPECNSENRDYEAKCVCGYDPEYSSRKSPETTVTTELRKDSKDFSPVGSTAYPALITIAGICKIFAWLNGILAVIGVIFTLVSGTANVVLVLSFLIGGAIGFIILYAISEIIYVFIDIEKNTRIVAQHTARKDEK